MKMDKGKETSLQKVQFYPVGCAHRNHDGIFWSECLYGSEAE